jgi:hypothetical protein
MAPADKRGYAATLACKVTDAEGQRRHILASAYMGWVIDVLESRFTTACDNYAATVLRRSSI